MLKLVELGWGRENSAFRQIFATQFIPESTHEQLKAFDELQRRTVTAETAAAILSMIHNVDVSASAKRVQCPTLVMHSRGDARIPFEEAASSLGVQDRAQAIVLARDHGMGGGHEGMP